jgi:hypothetical protein
MPIRKFRSVDEMEDTLWYDRADPALGRVRCGSPRAFIATGRSPTRTPYARSGKQ